MKRFLTPFVLVVLLAALTSPAWAEDKGVLQLQQQVTLLMSEVQDLQKGFEADVAAIKSLVSQNTDTVNKLTVTVGTIQETLNAQATVSGQRQDQLAQQFQSLTDSISELQARLNDTQQLLKQVQAAQQTIAAPQSSPGQPGALPAGQPGATGVAPGAVPAAGAAQAGAAGAPPAGGNGLPAAQLYQNGLSDYLSGAYPLAESELEQFIQTYPTDPQVPGATFYLGDIYYRQHDYDKAIGLFNTVIEQFPDSQQTPGAELKMGFSLLGKGDKQGCINAMKNLIQKYPQSEEAREAKEQLTSMGVSQQP